MQQVESRCHVPPLQETLRTAFLRRDLLAVPVVVRPRKGTELLATNKEFLGSFELTKSIMVESFMSPGAMGLNLSAESWWVVSSGRWCPSYYCNNYYYLPQLLPLLLLLLLLLPTACS